MVRVTGEQLRKTSGFVRAEARRSPVEDVALLRQNRKIAFMARAVPCEKAERIANNRMASVHDALNALMDD